MTFALLFRVTCCGAPIYEGRDEALASRIFEHLAACAGHHTVLEECDTSEGWTRVASSPTTQTERVEDK